MQVSFSRVSVTLCVFGVCALCAACASQPAIVADPPRHVHTPPEDVPWEEEYSRTRPQPEVFEEEGLTNEWQGFNGNLDQPPQDDGGVLQVVADVIAFPFRGIGWLLEQVF